MENSDELTFADYFKAEKEIYRAIMAMKCSTVMWTSW